MADNKMKPKPSRKSEPEAAVQRLYEAETPLLQSLRLTCATSSNGNLPEDQAGCKDPARSSDVIRHLIDRIKSI